MKHSKFFKDYMFEPVRNCPKPLIYFESNGWHSMPGNNNYLNRLASEHAFKLHTAYYNAKLNVEIERNAKR